MALAVSVNVFGQDLIHEARLLKLLKKRLASNPIFLKNLIVKKKLDSLDGFRSASELIVSERNDYIKYYKRYEKCYELSIQDKENILKKVNCKIVPTTYSLRNFPHLDQVDISTLLEKMNNQEELVSSKVFNFNQFVHTFRVFNEDRDSLGESYVLARYPRTSYELEVNFYSQLKLTSFDVKLIQRLQLRGESVNSKSKYKLNLENDIRISKSDFIFFDGDNHFKIILHKNKLLSDVSQSLNPDFIKYLTDKAEQTLYQVDESFFCFHMDIMNPSQYDCQSIHERGPQILMKKNISEIDFYLTNEGTSSVLN